MGKVGCPASLQRPPAAEPWRLARHHGASRVDRLAPWLHALLNPNRFSTHLDPSYLASHCIYRDKKRICLLVSCSQFTRRTFQRLGACVTTSYLHPAASDDSSSLYSDDMFARSVLAGATLLAAATAWNTDGTSTCQPPKSSQH